MASIGGMGNILKQAQEMQARMAKVQEDLANMTVQGSAGGGMVQVTVNGQFNLTVLKIEAAAINDRLYVRAVVKTSDLGASGALGPLAALLGDRERIQVGGVIRIIRPGFAELQVKEMKIDLKTTFDDRFVNEANKRVK